jgi:Tfp pilus assembly protein PilF
MSANRTTRSVLALLLCTSLFAAAQTTTHPSGQSGKTVRRSRVADDSVVRAEAAIDKKDFSTAESLLQESVKTDPQNFRAWYDLAFVYNATGRRPEALDAYRKSIAAKPDVFETNLNLGLMLAQDSDPAAEKYLRAATALKPASHPTEGVAQAWTALAHVLQKSDPRAAQAAWAKVAQLRPNDPEPHLAAAAAAEQAKDFATAEKEYEAAEQRDPKSAQAAAGLANVYMETKRMDQAEQALRKFLAVAEPGPASATAHVQLGRVLLELHRRAEAIPEFEEALKLAPDDPKAGRQVAWLYLQDKQYDIAESRFRELLAKAPNDAELHHGLGAALLQQKKFAEAEQELLRAVQLKADSGEAYGDLAFAASENKHYSLAVKALDARARFLKEIPGTLFLRATSLDHLGDRVNAANTYRAFLAVADGKFPDQEWQARHRLIAIDPNTKKK